MRLAPVGDAGHPRVRRALSFRDDVRIWSGQGAVVTTGRGVAGRWEIAVEVEPGCRGRGVGRAAVGADRAGERGERAGVPGRRVRAGGGGGAAAVGGRLAGVAG